MFSSLELRARPALSSIYRLGLEAPLAREDAGYAKLSSELMKELEGASKKVDNVLEGECRDLFSMVATRVFNHLLLRDPHFKFERLMRPVAEESSSDLAAAMGDHVCALLVRFSCDNDEDSGEEPPAMP
ncbi:hypothetical protein D1007_04207 [Hordeum vulgare]|nr:hypothetical protein D1007_04207 [Hordeum vulgare]